MYTGAGRDVWSGLGVTMLVGNGVGQSLWVNSTFWCETSDEGLWQRPKRQQCNNNYTAR